MKYILLFSLSLITFNLFSQNNPVSRHDVYKSIGLDTIEKSNTIIDTILIKEQSDTFNVLVHYLIDVSKPSSKIFYCKKITTTYYNYSDYSLQSLNAPHMTVKYITKEGITLHSENILAEWDAKQFKPN
jgi:hypothetical protein